MDQPPIQADRRCAPRRHPVDPSLKIGRSGRDRTGDPLVPNQVRYQTALRSEILYGADGGNRTRDLFLTKEVLYRLSHISAAENQDGQETLWLCTLRA